MDNEYFTLTFSRKELMDLQAALIQRAIVEDELRCEKGLESVSCRPLLERADQLLCLSDSQFESFSQALEDELWEYSWFSFTDEWAWFRARQDVERENCSKRLNMDKDALQRRVETRYQKDFEKYLNELEMNDTQKKESNKTQKKAA
jgi:hypothetical protein